MANDAPDTPQAQQPDLQAIAAAAALLLAQQGQAHKSAGFRGTTEGQLSMGMVILGVILMGISALAPVNAEVSAKLLSMAEQLLTFVPIAYTLSRGIAKGGLPIPGLKGTTNPGGK